MITLLCLLIAAANNIQNASAKIYFTADCEKQITRAIMQSKQQIDIAVYSITNRNIIDSLQNAKNRGVNIRIITDRLQAGGSSSLVQYLFTQGFDIKVNSVNRIMHHKFAIFDNKMIVQGSFNWTGSAASANAEDCIFSADLDDIKILNNRFDFLWISNKKNLSDCYIENLQKPKNLRGYCR